MESSDFVVVGRGIILIVINNQSYQYQTCLDIVCFMQDDLLRLVADQGGLVPSEYYTTERLRYWLPLQSDYCGFILES